MATVNAADQDEFNMIHKSLLRHHTNSLYADTWKIGGNLGLRIGDLLDIKFADLDLEKRTLSLVEGKTQKPKTLRLNEVVIDLVNKRHEQWPDDIYLFQSHSNRATKDQPVTSVSVGRAFKKAGEIHGLKISTHSMRKSRGKVLFDAGVPVAKISKILNHSSEAVTLRYLGISQEEEQQTYDDYVL
ncbi:hypothetical protein BJAS_P4319 [Bathymodiolus japonicus methanotrophic gill symbiont]|uniref:tyrosine-type recombinase/integrase n=1 Tax=Bathymodiolus japonicus methanotrophic gill symbiont TaxID=113269 RepID=UPI001B52D3C5|nr:tyrosine-type recombinase/integrase [Bathymodiolus japonicus methanotrophic gill symbiont]GFO73491.1 hypothetical protein BJAS_P4319 [Bathymodiolus japonicus methanotrophic gill symbiont]